MDIGKFKNNFYEDGKPRCFNCNIYRHISKECIKLKKDKVTINCYKYNRMVYLAKYYRLGQKMKGRGVQEESDKENDDKDEGFVEVICYFELIKQRNEGIKHIYQHQNKE